VEHCPSGALSLSEADGKLDIDHSRCVLCAYCTPHCPMFVLRMA
jgi:Fe-S-cluster-containing dehydrogenase component